jgi:uncharacterized protein with PQ loop repeat
MSASGSQLLGTAATVYGVIAPLSALLQARQMLARRSSREVSVRFFASYAGGYAIWLLYGLSAGSTPLIVVDAVGVLCAGLTLAVALAVRGSLARLASWTGRATIPVPRKVRSPRRRPSRAPWPARSPATTTRTLRPRTGTRRQGDRPGTARSCDVASTRPVPIN